MASLAPSDEMSIIESHQNEGNRENQFSDLKKKSKSKKSDLWKRRRKSECKSTKDLPSLPECGHSEKRMHCAELNKDDVLKFQNSFYEKSSKVKQDIFILRHCAVSAPKRCRSKDGIQRKSMVVHYYVSKLSGNLISVCRTTFTSLLGIKSGRVQGVVNRYIQSKKIPTENRGGDRHSKKFQRKLQSVSNYLSDLPGAKTNCGRCGSTKTVLSVDEDMRKLWYNYNVGVSYDLRVVESYFRTIFTKHFNISFGASKDKEKDHCYRCSLKKKGAHLPVKEELKDDDEDDTIDDTELKILEMSFPPGEHFLFAPIPPKREPIEEREWRSGDEIEYENIKYGSEVSKKTPQQEAKENQDVPTNTLENYQQHSRDSPYNQGTILQNLLARPVTELEFHIVNGCQDHNSHPLATHESQLHLAPPQHGNLMNLHHMHQSNIESIHLQPHSHYIMHPSHHSMMHQTQQQHTLIHSYGNNSIIHNNDVSQSNLALNINTNISKDSNVIHLGSHYVNLQPAQNTASHHLHPSIVTNTDYMKQDYHYLDLGNQHSQTQIQQNNHEQQEKLTLPKTEEQTKIKKPLFKCLPCKLVFKSQNIYNLHKKRHIESKVLKCEHCGRNFVRTDSFKRHTQTHFVKKPYECEKCGQSFAHEINRDIHVARHNQITDSENCQNSLRCNICLKMFTCKVDLDAHNDWHRETNHSKQGSDSIICNICNEKFRCKISFDTHLKSHHDANESHLSMTPSIEELSRISQEAKILYKCDVCGFEYSSSAKLQRHMETHNDYDTKKYQCKLCDRKFEFKFNYMHASTFLYVVFQLNTGLLVS